MLRASFHPIIARWFCERFEKPTEAQVAGWPAILKNQDTQNYRVLRCLRLFGSVLKLARQKMQAAFCLAGSGATFKTKA